MALTRPDLKRSSPVSLKRQIAEHIAAAVENGELAPGEKLPAGRELAQEWEVGYSTITDAMHELVSRGVLVAAMGKGTFVADHALPGTAMARDGRPRAARGRAGHGVLRAPGCAITRTSPERHSACDTLDR